MLHARLLLALALALTAAPARSAEDRDDDGFHLGAAYGQSDLGGSEAGSEDTHEAFAGYHFRLPMAVEVGWHDLGTVVTPLIDDGGSVFDGRGIGVSALGQLRLGRITPYGRLGVLSWEEDGYHNTIAGPRPFEASGQDLYWGVGIDGRVAAGLALRAEWRALELEHASGGQWLLGAAYRF